MRLKSYIWPNLDDAVVDDEDRARRRPILEQLQAIERLCFCLLGAVGVTIAVYSASLLRTDTLHVFAHVFALLSAAMLAALTVGGVLGFIFGIPRFLRQAEAGAIALSIEKGRGQTSRAADKGYRSYVGNTNLEEISDWLTKIIIGLGLVEARKIMAIAQDAGTRFAGEMHDAEGAGALFTAVVVTAFSGGFLLFYLETRTRITLLLTDSDLAAKSNDITKDETEAVLDSPIVSQSDSKVASAGSQPQVIEADQRFLGIRFESLRKPEEFAAWGAAQARANNIEAAVRALIEAIGRSPDKVRYLRMLADVRLRQNNPQAAVKILSEARSKSPHDEVRLLRKELLASLYLPQPDSFTHALAIAESLLRKSHEAAADPMVQIWRAAAFGQKYSWLLRNNGTPQELERTREDALQAVRDVIRLTPDDSHARKTLRDIFDPITGNKSGDNDLSVFYGDPDFMSLIPERSSAPSP